VQHRSGDVHGWTSQQGWRLWKKVHSVSEPKCGLSCGWDDCLGVIKGVNRRQVHLDWGKIGQIWDIIMWCYRRNPRQPEIWWQGYGLGPISRNSGKVFRPEKPLVKLWPTYSVKLVFSYVVKGIKIKITAKFRASKCLRFEDTKRVSPPEMHPERFVIFKKRAPDQQRCPF